MSQSTSEISIIGSGVAGLAAACRLASKGFKVDVFEKGEKPGGKLNEANWNGYRFDLGPSLFTLPHVFDDIFTSANKNPRDYFDYHCLETVTHYFFEDGTRFKSYGDLDKWSTELKTKIGLEPSLLKTYLKHVKHVYDVTSHIFLDRSLHKPSTYLRWKTLWSILNLPTIGALRTMAKANKKAFNNPYMEQYFNRFATYNGSNPYLAPSTLNLIAHVEHGLGAYYPKGGMYSIAKALYALAIDLGVTFHFQTEVKKIHTKNNRAVSIELANGTYQKADKVISNMDVYYTYKKLLGQEGPKKIMNQEKSSSALIFYWGIKKTFPELHLHNILFSNNYQKEFEDIFNNRVIADDPTVYINITSKLSPDDAPEGAENWFVMVNAPNHQGQDWIEMREKAKRGILEKLKRVLKTDVEPFIETEHFLDPVLIESSTYSHKGALYGNSSNNAMAAFFRHANFSSSIENLYFCGGSVHPGGGIPLAALSGKIVADMI